MQVTSLLSRASDPHAHEHQHEPDESCASCGHEHEHTPVRLKQTLVGLIFIVNAFLVSWLFEKDTLLDDASAMIGALILGYPIVWTSVKDIRRGTLSINELVSIAVLAAFASGQYTTAGIVAFFMLRSEERR